MAGGSPPGGRFSLGGQPTFKGPHLRPGVTGCLSSGKTCVSIKIEMLSVSTQKISRVSTCAKLNLKNLKLRTSARDLKNPVLEFQDMFCTRYPARGPF